MSTRLYLSLSLELSLCEALYLSFLWSSLPNCEGAWQRTVTYRAHHCSFVVRWPPCTHWHIGTVTYQSHWEAKTKLGHQETIVLGCCTVPAYYNYSSLFYIQEISISICFVPQGAGRVGVGQIGPRFAARVKNSPKNSQLLGLLTLTIDRFVTFSWFLRRVSCQHGISSSSSSFHIYIFHALNAASKILTNASWNENFEYANNQLQKFS